VPKSKVRKKPDTPVRVPAAAPTGRQLAPSPAWYPIVMGVLLLVGLAWLVTYYIAPSTPLISDLGNWNFLVGFGIMLLGLVMAVRWR
jgi:polyferredoxin